MRSPRRLYRPLAAGVVSMALSLVLAACGASSSTSGDGGGEQPLTLGFVNGGTTEFHKCLAKAMRAQAQAENVELLVANSAGKPAEELSNVENMIIQQADAIILQTVNTDALEGAVSQANRADVPIFLTSVAAVDRSKILGAVTAETQRIGRMAGTWVAEDATKPPAKVAIVGGAPGAASDLMIKGFKQGLGKAGTVVFAQPAFWQRAKALAVTENLLQSHPDVEYILAVNENMAFGVLEALRAAGRDDVEIVTNGGTPEGLEAVRAGKFSATVSNTPRAIGRMAVKSVVALLAEPGSVEKIQSVPLMLVTKDNADQAPKYCGG